MYSLHTPCGPLVVRLSLHSIAVCTNLSLCIARGSMDLETLIRSIASLSSLRLQRRILFAGTAHPLFIHHAYGGSFTAANPRLMRLQTFQQAQSKSNALRRKTSQVVHAATEGSSKSDDKLAINPEILVGTSLYSNVEEGVDDSVR